MKLNLIPPKENYDTREDYISEDEEDEEEDTYSEEEDGYTEEEKDDGKESDSKETGESRS